MEKKLASFDGVRISYDISRIGEKFIVFLHGAGGDSNAWKKERKYLHQKGYSTIAIDLRGHGKSEDPLDVKDYALNNFAEDVFGVIKKEEVKKFILVGHCFGGVVSILFHKLHPKLAKAYVLVDTTYKAPRSLHAIFNFDKPFIRFVDKELLNRFDFVEKKHTDFEQFKGTADYSLRRIYNDIIMTGLRAWIFTYQNLAEFDGTKILKSMRQKVLVIEGEKDTIFNTGVAAKISELAKKSQLRIIPDANHIVVVNNPRQLEHEIKSFADSILK